MKQKNTDLIVPKDRCKKLNDFHQYKPFARPIGPWASKAMFIHDNQMSSVQSWHVHHVIEHGSIWKLAYLG